MIRAEVAAQTWSVPPFACRSVCLPSLPFPRARRPVNLLQQGIYGYRRYLLLRFVRWAPSPLEQAEALEQLRALENGVKIHVVVTKSGSPGVDTPADARAIERLLLSPATTRRAGNIPR